MFNRKQFGQSSILGIAFALMITTGIYTLYNTNRVTADKTQLVNAADAAVYSSGVHVARNLNYIAYTNRAMISNHIAIGHLTSYWSWLQYAESHIEFIDNVCDILCPFFPPLDAILGTYLDIVDELAEFAVDVAEARGFLAGQSNVTNGLYYTSQLAARAAILPGVIDGVQEDILQSFDSNIERHRTFDSTSEVDFSGNQKLNSAIIRTVADKFKIEFYLNILPFQPTDDDGLIAGIVEQSVDFMAANRSDDFFRNGDSRDRNLTIVPSFFRLRKEGQTDHLETDDGLSWYAADSLDLQAFNFTKFRWETVLEVNEETAQTDTDDILDGYTGIPFYTAEAEDKLSDCYRASVSGRGVGILGTGEEDCLGLTLIAKRPLSQSKLLRLGDQDHAQEGQQMFAISRAEIFFERPFNMLANFSSDEAEFANLFNPFWKARLSD